MRRFTAIRLSSAALSVTILVISHPVLAQTPSCQGRDLGTLGGLFAEPANLNEAGQVTGYPETLGGQIHVFLHEEGQMLDPGALAAGGSAGRALNDTGAVSGITGAAGGLGHAFRYDPNDMVDLGTAGLGGHVLGRYTISDPADGSMRTGAFIATPATALFDKLVVAIAIRSALGCG